MMCRQCLVGSVDKRHGAFYAAMRTFGATRFFMRSVLNLRVVTEGV